MLTFVVCIEHASAQQRHAHGLEIIRTDVPDGRHRVFAVTLARRPLGTKIRETSAATDGKVTRHARRLHRGERFHCFNKPAIELRLLRPLRVGALRKRKQKARDVVRVESRVDPHQLAKALDQQTGTANQDQRHGDLCDYRHSAIASGVRTAS
jgi:hypothetical protein